MPQFKADSPTDDGIVGTSAAQGKSGVFGFNARSNGVAGISVEGNGIYAKSDVLNGAYGESRTGAGVHGRSIEGVAVYASSDQGDGVVGVTRTKIKSGVFGSNESKEPASAPGGSGVFGLTVAPGAAGVFGANNSAGPGGRGVQGNGPEAGVGGWSENGTGVVALSKNIGLLAQGGNLAARFVGDVEVTGDVRLANADCAEAFDVAGSETVAPGTVMVFDTNGDLVPCWRAYDRCVAGVVSGAGTYRPALLLDQRPSQRTRQPIALVGKVFCRVDARHGSIEVGALLTTSPTPGAAMAAADRDQAFGAVIGKALAPHIEGEGLIPILVALQ